MRNFEFRKLLAFLVQIISQQRRWAFRSHSVIQHVVVSYLRFIFLRQNNSLSYSEMRRPGVWHHSTLETMSRGGVNTPCRHAIASIHNVLPTNIILYPCVPYTTVTFSSSNVFSLLCIYKGRYVRLSRSFRKVRKMFLYRYYIYKLLNSKFAIGNGECGKFFNWIVRTPMNH